jgi:tetratricopeptide (TPR) repeat protein
MSISVTHVKDFGLAGATIHNEEFIVGGNELGIDSAGLLGQNLWSRFDTEFDLANGVIRLLRSKDCGKAPLVYWTTTQPYSELALETLDSLHLNIAADATVNGAKIRVMFDTGAGTSMLFRTAAARAGIKIDGAGVEAGGLQWGIGRRYVQTWIAPVSSFKLGDEEVQHTHLRIGDERDIDGADMLLGTDFFLTHRVYVSHDQGRIYFTYNGGPVFNLTTTPLRVAAPPPAAESNAPATAANAASPPAAPATATDASTAPGVSATAAADAAGFARIGASQAARHEFSAALENLDRACALAPDEPSYYLQRGSVHLALSQPDLALEDLDAVLSLQPNNLEALLRRGFIRLTRRDETGARADADAAAVVASPQSDARIEIAELYARLDSADAAVAQLDVWIPAHPNDRKAGDAYNLRCRIRTRPGQPLKQALDDCNRAMRREASGDRLDSRGWVYLRLGDYRNAIDDFDAALKMDPNIAFSYYGRGVAELRTGKSAQGQDDVAEARGLDAKIDARAQAFGIAADALAAPH